MIKWGYDPTKADIKKSYELLPEGNYRIRVAETQETTSKKGNDMIKITFDVSGTNTKLFHYLVIDVASPAAEKRTQTNFKRFLDAFNLSESLVYEPSQWVNYTGGCVVFHNEYEGKTYANIRYFLSQEETEELPEWIEPGIKSHDSKPVEDNILSFFKDGDDAPF